MADVKKPSVAPRRLESMLLRVSGVVVVVVFCVILAIGLRAGRVRTERQAIAQVEKALLCYYLDFGAFPAPGAEEAALRQHGANPYHAQFLKRWPAREGLRDHWGRPLCIKPGRHNPRLVDIYSLGPNGRDEQGQGDDIENWLAPAQ